MSAPVRKAVFPIAGLGTRFLPATKAMAKEMLTVVDRPLIQHVVDEARAAGIEHFIFVTGRNKGAIEDHFDRQAELEAALAEISGLDRVTLQPAAGAQGEFIGVRMISAYHRARGDAQRTRVLIPDTAHGTNPASAALNGLDVVEVKSGPDGVVHPEALAVLADERTAALMLTNPNTLGLFEEEIQRVTEVIHGVGGLVDYDWANLNAILGRCRPGDMGFDIVHINTHKTFATPHGGGGPGAGPVGVTEALVPFLPVPRVERLLDGSFGLETALPDSIGRMHGFLGNFAILVRAYAYVFLHGGDGLREVAERAVLNANYLAHLVKEAFPLEYPDAPPMHEFVASARTLREQTGVRAMDVAKRVIDLGYHPSTVYFPLVVEEAMMVEPTETETQEALDAFAEALLQAAREAHEDPDLLHQAPVTTPVRRLDEARAARHLTLRW